MINICTKYGFDILIISGSYGGHRRHTTDDSRQTTDDVRRTTPRVWHKLPTGELKNNFVSCSSITDSTHVSAIVYTFMEVEIRRMIRR